MYTIRKTFGQGKRFPDTSLLEDYKNCHYTDMISYAALNAMKGENVLELGDSGDVVEIQYCKNAAGTEKAKIMLDQYSDNFSRMLETAIPKMSAQYKNFYHFFMKDMEKHGKKILLPA